MIITISRLEETRRNTELNKKGKEEVAKEIKLN